MQADEVVLRQHLAIAWLMRRAIKWPANQQ